MINLSSLAALLRTLRLGGGAIDGPAAAVSRVAPVARVASDDDAEISSSALRQQALARSVRPPLVGVPDEPQAATNASAGHAASARVGLATRGASAVSVAASAHVASTPVESASLEFTTVGALLRSALRGSGTAAPHPPVVEASSPLTERAAGPATALARSLAHSVSESGLFYESHVARWARNAYPQSALSREPQASWPARMDAPPGANAAQPSLPDAAAALVGRQLDVLDTRQLVWIGELWPGQHATIELEEAPHDVEDRDAEVRQLNSSVWRTRLQLELPSLGRVSATVMLAGGRFDVALDTDSRRSAERLDAARAELDQALGASKLELRDFAVAVTHGGSR